MRSNLVILFVAFAISRLFYLGIAGVRFDTQPLDYFIQYIDPVLLQNDLARSLWYLHFQPPAFNLFLGTVLKLFPDHFLVAYQSAYLVVGFLFALVQLELLLALGVKRPLALILTILHAILPSTVLYENCLFYSYPVAMLMTASAVFLHRYLTGQKFRHAFLFFSTLALISLTHAIFSLAWFLIITVGLVILRKTRRPQIARAYALPLVVLLFFAAKNYAISGSITPGASLLGLNLAVRLGPHVTQKEAHAYVAAGDVPYYYFYHVPSPISLDYIPDEIPKDPTGVPVLDDPFKTNGEINLNNRGYIAVGREFERGSFKIMRDHPVYYLMSFIGAAAYFNPAGEPFVVEADEYGQQLRTFVHAQSLALGSFDGGVSWVLVLTLPTLLIFGIRRAWHQRHSRGPQWVMLVFLLFNILYSSILTIAVSFGDWNRYRFTIDPFYVALLGLALTGLSSTLERASPNVAPAKRALASGAA